VGLDYVESRQRREVLEDVKLAILYDWKACEYVNSFLDRALKELQLGLAEQITKDFSLRPLGAHIISEGGR
jgi:hypothetical protein